MPNKFVKVERGRYPGYATIPERYPRRDTIEEARRDRVEGRGSIYEIDENSKLVRTVLW